MSICHKKANVRHKLFSIVAVTFLVAIVSGCASTKPLPYGYSKKEDKTETSHYTLSGRDLKTFSDAAALYSTNRHKLLDDTTAKSILFDLGASAKKDIPWSSKFCAQLDRLSAVRISNVLIGEVRNTGNKMVIADKAPSQVKVAKAKQYFAQGNDQYEAGRFDKAIDFYRLALEEYPAFWDAWNNTALAEMQRNNDLVALFLLSALTKNNPKYPGGFINLSVCLERLGQNTAAYDIAGDVALKQAQMPIAQYNMAWFENARGKYESAQKFLSKVQESIPDYPVAKRLQTINSMEAGRNITADDLKALPSNDQSQGIPKIVVRTVSVATADAYAGNTVIAKIKNGSPLVISDTAGDWQAFYWPVDNVKRRLWTKQANLDRFYGNNPYIRFFESGYDAPDYDKRTYETVFVKSKVRYINWELNLKPLPRSQRIDFNIDAVWLRPDGSEFYRDTKKSWIEADWTSSYHNLGYGNRNGGAFTTGTYTVELYIDGNKVVVGSFKIVD